MTAEEITQLASKFGIESMSDILQLKIDIEDIAAQEAEKASKEEYDRGYTDGYYKGNSEFHRIKDAVEKARKEERSKMSEAGGLIYEQGKSAGIKEERERHSYMVKLIKDAMIYDYNEWDFLKQATIALKEAGYAIKEESK